MDWNLIGEIAVSFFLVVGGVFALVGSWGLIKLPDLMTRLHAPTKATTLGVGGVLIAAMLNALAMDGRGSFHELMITIFLLLTAPITAHFIAKAWMHRRGSAQAIGLPPTGGGAGWATFEAPDKQEAEGPAAEVAEGGGTGAEGR